MMSRILNGLMSLIIAAMIICALIGIRPMIIMSGSMEPAIKTGSLSLVNTKSNYEKIEKEDVITYNLLDGKVTHRAVKITDEGVITKGDANKVEDLGLVTSDNYYGKVILSVPYLGFVFHFIRRHLILCMSLIAAIIFLLSIRNFKEKRNDNK